MTDESTTPPPSAPPPPPPAASQPPMPPPAATGGGGGVSENRNVMIVLSYLWILCLIPLLVEKDDPEVQWHAKHGLVLLGVEIVLYVLLGIASAVVSIFACIGCFGYAAVALAFLGIRIMAIVKGVKGERFKVPPISDWVDSF